MPEIEGQAGLAANSGDRLRELRIMSEESQREFAATLGVSEATYQRAERGALPGPDLLLGLLRTGFSADWVLSGRGSMSIDAVEDCLREFARRKDAQDGKSAKHHRATQIIDLPRLVDSYGSARDRLSLGHPQAEDPFRLMELTLALYDVLTIGAEASAARAPASATEGKELQPLPPAGPYPGRG